MTVWLALALAVLLGLFWFLQGDAGSLAASGLDEVMPYLGALVLGLYALFLLGGHRARVGQAMRHLAVWGGVMLAFVALYAYRSEISVLSGRVLGELAPPGHSVAVEVGDQGERAVRVRRRPDGHFMARVEIDGAPVSMLVDTGASTVVLKPADAERAGIDTKALKFTVPVQTANGTTYAAPARLRAVSIGGIVVRDVEALVSKPGNLKESLLGMSFLRRLRSYEFSGEFLTLRS